MDYEKKYKEALSWMQSLYKGLHGATKEDAEHYFPELKESEDEKAIRDIKVVLESSATKFFKEEGKMPVWYDRAIAWLEKSKSTAIDIDKMVDEFEHSKVISRGIPSFIEIDAYRKGVVDTLSKILIKEEKPITVGSKKAEGKLGEMIAASKEPAESGEDEELSHKEVSKKSEQDDKWKWDEDDEKFFRENILIGLGNIHDFSPELYSKIIDWISLIKRRLS